MRHILRVLTGVIVIGISTSSFAQEPAKQAPTARPRQAKPAPKTTSEAGEKTESVAPIPEPDEAMRSVIANLSIQIGLLSEEVRGLKRETERSSGMLELLLNEERLSKLEDKIQETSNQKAQLDAREQEIQRRMRNIQGELVVRGGLRREEAEAAARNDLQRALEDVRSQQITFQQRLAELNEQAARLRARNDTLRKRLEHLEGTREKEEK